MAIKILAIGDVANIIRTIKKYSKFEIHLINYPKDGAGKFIYQEGAELFESSKVKEQVKKINQIKDNFDVCLTTGSERVAYLADLNYIAYYLGRDIDVPMFKKNSTEQWQKDSLHQKNFLERKFYWKAFKNAVTHVAGMWQYESLKKYTKSGINSARIPIDVDEFNPSVKPISLKKNKFTFFSPMRMEKAKGTDILWKALKLCKSDFDVIGVDWYGETTEEERKFKKKLIQEMPPQIRLIPTINKKDIPKYYTFADAVIANLFIGTFELVGLESIMCGTPVIQYTNKQRKIIIDGNEIDSPFLPFSNDPKDIAETIDKIVDSDEFREKLLNEEQKFVKIISDPKKCAEWWDKLFEKTYQEKKSIRKNSLPILVRFRMINFLIVNRLYLNKLNRLIRGRDDYEKQTMYK